MCPSKATASVFINTRLSNSGLHLSIVLVSIEPTFTIALCKVSARRSCRLVKWSSLVQISGLTLGTFKPVQFSGREYLSIFSFNFDGLRGFVHLLLTIPARFSDIAASVSSSSSKSCATPFRRSVRCSLESVSPSFPLFFNPRFFIRARVCSSVSDSFELLSDEELWTDLRRFHPASEESPSEAEGRYSNMVGPQVVLE